MIALLEAHRAGLLRREHWLPNIVAGVIVGVVALPLAMAFAIASGAKPEQGLYTAIVAGLIVSAFGGSRLQIAGPTGAFIVILAGVTAKHGIDGLQIATLMAGVMLLLLGVARLGAVIRFIPDPVVVGFTAGIGVIIWVGQWKDFFGLPPVTGAHFHDKLWHLLQTLPGLDPTTTGLALGSLLLVIFAPRVPGLKRVPGPLVALVVATVLQAVFRFDGVTTIVTGIFQITLGFIGADRLIRYIPKAVMVGFVDALGILIFSSQLRHVFGKSLAVWLVAGLGLALLLVVPRLIKAVPAALLVVPLLAIGANVAGLHLPTVADGGELPTRLPVFHLPTAPFNWHTMAVVVPYAAALAIVGLLESLLTAQMLDEITATPSNKGRECRGQGLANIVTGFFGGMAGCALIGQSLMNVRNGARTRLSTLASGVFLALLVFVFGGLVGQIPMVALAAVMVVVAGVTFDWSSIVPAGLRQALPRDLVVTAVTVALVLATDNLAIGVVGGVMIALAIRPRVSAAVV